MPGPDDIRDAQRTTWDGLAAGWERWDEVIAAQLRPVGDAMTERLRVDSGASHLDIASGTGEPGLTVARRLPAARVVLTDLAPEMLAVAERRARAEGLTNVETWVCSADDLPFDDASFDTVSVRFGLMFVPDLAATTGELARVLRPGGRLCSAVWVDPARNPWTGIVMEAIGAEIDLPDPDPSGPNMYRCGAPGLVADLFEGAGLRDVVEWEVPVELVTGSAEEYWRVMSEHVSLAVAVLARADAGTRQRIRAKTLDRVRAYRRGDEIRVPGLARCTVGTR